MVQNNSSDSRIHVDGKYNASKKCSEVIKDLGLIFELDKDSEKKVSYGKKFLKVGCWGTFISPLAMVSFFYDMFLNQYIE